MEKRNTLLLTIIAIATLLVAVVGATFAYFASAGDTTEGLNLTARTVKENTAISSVSSEMLMEVTSSDMSRSNANNDEAAVTANGTLTVNLVGAQNQEGTRCKYDVVFQWADDSSEYVHSPLNQEGLKEFTLGIDLQQGNNFNNGTTQNDAKNANPNYIVDNQNTAVMGSGSSGNNSIANVRGRYSTGTLAWDDGSDSVSTEIDFSELSFDSNTGKAPVINNVVIYNNSSKANGTTQIFTFNTFFYNLDLLQSAGEDDQGNVINEGEGIENKEFKGRFLIDNVECISGYETFDFEM